MSKHAVAPVRDIPPGARKLFTVKGRPVAIFNIKGEFFGLFNRCPHQGGSLCHGSLTGLLSASEPSKYEYSREGEIVRCPWHGWEFDIKTGQSYFDPKGVQTRSYPVEIEPGTQVAKGPYIAETVTVTVEEDYVVVTL